MKLSQNGFIISCSTNLNTVHFGGVIAIMHAKLISGLVQNQDIQIRTYESEPMNNAELVAPPKCVL